MHAPVIKTALPKRRYQWDDFSLTVLGEVVSGDGRDYEYILALVREGSAKPLLYITSERVAVTVGGAGSHRLRIVAESMDEDLSQSERWKDIDAFVAETTAIIARMFALNPDTLYRLL